MDRKISEENIIKNKDNKHALGIKMGTQFG
jgi:hypothetical protein